MPSRARSARSSAESDRRAESDIFLLDSNESEGGQNQGCMSGAVLRRVAAVKCPDPGSPVRRLWEEIKISGFDLRKKMEVDRSKV